MNNNKLLIMIFPVIFTGIFCLSLVNTEADKTERYSYSKIHPHKACFEYLPLRDTVYVLSDRYIMVSLKHQNATMYFRHESPFTFKISSGNGNLHKGIFTPTGIYTVQSRSTLAISKQFENSELYNWVGFNGNIGFHGLKGSGYYWNLGVRPSSHGCVRMSREDGAILFKKAKIGTPVMVYDEAPARIFEFGDIHNFDFKADIMIPKYWRRDFKFYEDRINALYNGTALTNNIGNLYLDGKTALKAGGISTGAASRIPSKQKKPLYNKEYNTHYIVDKLHYEKRVLMLRDTTKGAKEDKNYETVIKH